MIHDLTLTNFKCFDSLSLSLNMLTVIAGQNGAGKSSLLQSLLLLRQSYTGNITDFSNRLVINGRLANMISADKIFYKYAKTDKIRISVYDTELNNDFSVSFSGNDGANPECIYSENYKEALKSCSLFSPDFVYLYANRLSPQDEYIKNESHYTDSRLGDKTGNMSVFHLLSALDLNEKLPIQELRFEHTDSLSIYRNVGSWISYIMDTELSVSASGDTQKASLIYKADNSDISPLNMAFGDTYILPIILAVLTAPKKSLLIFENPEAHLHPKAQFRIGIFLAKAAEAGIQILIETHSDHLLNGIRVAANKNLIQADNVIIHFITKEKNNHYDYPINLQGDGSLDSWPSGFFDEWEYALRELNDN